MIDPRIIIKANYNRTLVTIRVTAIDSPDWVDIVGTRIELFRDAGMANRFVNNTTTHYKVRAYLENPTPNQTIYGRVTLTKNDNTTLVKTFNFVTPYPVLGTVKDEDGTQYIASMRKMDKNGNLSSRNYTNKVAADQAAYIDIVADEAGEMIVGNQWTTPILVQNVTQGLTEVEVAQNASTTVSVNDGDVVRVKEGTENVTFRTFSSTSNPLCKGVSAHISVMPAMDKFTYNAQGTSVDRYFFYAFNQNGTLTSLPEGSFDTHKINSTVNQRNDNIFANFNASGALTSLPEGSFDTYSFASNSTSWDYNSPLSNGFQYFNQRGALTSLPEGSFDFDNASIIGRYAFRGFNNNGALTSFPEGSFGFSSLTTPNNSYSNYFPEFNTFNSYGRLTTMPAGAFHFKPGLTGLLGYDFNSYGSLTALPEHSFNFLIGGGTFAARDFNKNGALTSLPEGSFKIAPNVTNLGSSAFSGFNQNGALTSLPEGSFNTENLVYLSQYSFNNFNYKGALTSLPEGSFNFDSALTAQEYCFASFNESGALKTLPKGSFSLKNLTTITGYGFLYRFNQGGMLEYLPIEAFSIDSVTSMPNNWTTFSLWEFNHPDSNGNGGLLTESETDYNSRFVYITPSASGSCTFSYYDRDSDAHYTKSISKGLPTKYYQADYFNVVYTESQAYTTDLASEYLSGQTITFSASAIDPEYMITPTITTDGGTTVTFTDNGDDTYTFVMPQDNINVSFAVAVRPATITLVAEEAGTMVVTNKWSTPVIVQNITQGTAPVTVIAGYNMSANIPVDLDDEVTVTESSTNTTFRNWGASADRGFATGVLTRITKFPRMNRFTTNMNGQSVGNNFFRYFCRGDNQKGITAFPAGALDTSDIRNIGQSFFTGFNYQGLLTSLPDGSFNISGMTSAESTILGFFNSFNNSGALTSLPAGSFNTGNISRVNRWFFSSFNAKGALTSLPAGSFDTSKITSVKEYFFNGFNSQGALTSLPAGSFDTSNITTASESFFYDFNSQGALTSLPAGSFDTSNITTVAGDQFFRSFNTSGALTSLPEGSFNISNITSVNGSNFFGNFNQSGALTSLPAGSFDISNITAVAGGYFFNSFNANGALTSLPTGSFDISNIAGSVGESFFTRFNNGGALTSLPAGSFDTSAITSAGKSFFSSFNYNGELTSLPAGSFNTSNITNNPTSFFFSQFNQGGHIPKDTTSYNPNFINPSTERVMSYYYGASTGEQVAQGNPFYYKTT